MKLDKSCYSHDELWAETQRLENLLRRINEWRHSPEFEKMIDVTGTLIAMKHYLSPGNVGQEFRSKYYPLLEQLDQEFPVKKESKP